MTDKSMTVQDCIQLRWVSAFEYGEITMEGLRQWEQKLESQVASLPADAAPFCPPRRNLLAIRAAIAQIQSA